MTSHRALLLLASVALSTSVLGACSRSATSPTEPSLAAFDAPKSLSSVADDSHGGGNDDGTADDNQGRGRGTDDGTADQGRGRGRGGDDGTADQGRGRGRRGRGEQPGQPRPPRAGREFEGTVLSVSGQTLALAGGLRVTVDGQTQFSARGDLRSLAALAASVAANEAPRVEGRGDRQTDGSILASTIKAEVDR